MLDVSVAYNRYKFLGYEFLTWVWYLIDINSDISELTKDESDAAVDLRIGSRIVLEKQTTDTVEKITIKGDDAGLEEGRIALRKGALVTELHLQFGKNDQVWTFNIKGESLNISTLKAPDTGPVENKEDIEGVVLEKIYLYYEIINFIIKLYHFFIDVRLSPDWEASILADMRKWIGN